MTVKNPQDETHEGVRIFPDVRKTLHSLLVISGPRVRDHIYNGSPMHSGITSAHAIKAIP
jgi:hypothetical protein